MNAAERAIVTHKVRVKLIRRPRTLTLTQIGKDTGLTAGWLKVFIRAGSNRPNLIMVETLGRYLDKHEEEARAHA